MNLSIAIKRKTIYTLAGAALFTAILTGCGSEPAPKPVYKPTALIPEARGITVASSKPYNCKIVGETEALELVGNTSGASLGQVREGAINKLKQEAVYAVGVDTNRKIMISLTKEEGRCKKYDKRKKLDVTTKCPSLSDETPDNVRIISYRVYGDVYECGLKNGKSTTQD